MLKVDKQLEIDMPKTNLSRSANATTFHASGVAFLVALGVASGMASGMASAIAFPGGVGTQRELCFFLTVGITRVFGYQLVCHAQRDAPTRMGSRAGGIYALGLVTYWLSVNVYHIILDYLCNDVVQ